jgi:peptidylprolyl isomerase
MIARIMVAAAALAAAGSVQAQTPPASPAAAPAAEASSDWRTLDPQNVLVVDTTKGRLIVELRPDIAPLAVARIKALTRRGYYNGSLFYRVIKDFVAQTGDKGERQFTSDLPNLKAEFTFTRKPADYAFVGSFPGGEVGFVGTMPVQIDKLPSGEVTKGWPLFCQGVAAMPHTNEDINSANSQLYFMRQPAQSLEQKYTAFGRLVEGVGAVRAMTDGEPPANPDKMTRVRVLADIPAAQRPTVQVLDAHSASFTGIVQQAARAKGTAFSLCDVEIPVHVTGG